MDISEIYGLAVSAHDRANKTYCAYSYELHLKGVMAACNKFANLWFDEKQIMIVQAACACHDLIEDCRMNYNDVVSMLDSAGCYHESTEIADIVYAVSNELGKTRKERTQNTYPKIKENDLAIFVKLCDRIANSLFSVYTSDPMFRVYALEFDEFERELRKEGQYTAMWEYLKGIYSAER